MSIYSSHTKQSTHWPFNSGITEYEYANQYWHSLYYFNLYRFIIGGILVITTWKFQLANIGSHHYLLFLYTGLGYIFFSSMAMLFIKLRYPNIHWQLTIQITADIIFFSVMLYASGGIQSGLGDLLLVSLAGAGLISRGHLVLFFASIATISLLLQETYALLTIDSYPVQYAQAGLLGMAYFAVAYLARQLAKHTQINEQLATEHSIELANMSQINQLVIQNLQEGILVVDKYDNIRQRNTLAEKLLNLDSSTHQTGLLKLSDCAPEIANRLTSWQSDNDINFNLLRLNHSNTLIRTRFLPMQSDFRNGVIIFLEGIEHIQTQSQQLKLAALGRLSANIAHEIRNPLSAINHAAELLEEEKTKNSTTRLVRIIRENTQRLNKIVQDILQPNQFNIPKSESIDIKEFIERFLEEFCHTENIDMNVFVLDSAKNYWINFDRNHLNQVLWNLCRNAWRHCHKQAGSVHIELSTGAHENGVQLDIIDDGAGVDPHQRKQIFEPFFTTATNGTGLGLYIAREMCETNHASLEYVESSTRGYFRIIAKNSQPCL